MGARRHVRTLTARRFPIGSAEAVDLGHQWELTPGRPEISAPGHTLLGWLASRTPGPGENLPVPPPWPQPPTPGWGRPRHP
ncbi:hypothetical protein [Nonomuraea sp. NPDC003709]|uniref:hypothetical protein n=1 Tax=Nonomuraea sp. NPDC003709 TaxID=3154450 RepID=UPI0033BF5603